MFSADNAGLVGGISLLVGVAAFVLTIAGFWITIVQLLKTKDAAEASSVAITSLKNRMRIFDSSVESSRVIKYLEAAILYLKNKSWGVAAISLWEGQTVLRRVLEDMEQDSNYRALTEENIEKFLNIIEDLESIEEKGIVNFNSAPIVKTIRTQINLLERKIIQSQKEAQDAR